MSSTLLNSALNALHDRSAGVVTAAIFASDGLVIASSLPVDIDQERFGSMVAAILSLGARTTHELGCGTPQHLLVKSDQGHLLLVQAGAEAIMAAVIKAEASLDIVIEDVLQTATDAGRLLG